MNISIDKVTEIFYLTDEFCRQSTAGLSAYKIGNAPKRKPLMSDSEVITLMTLFHSGGFRNIKHFYQHYVQKHLRSEFPNTVPIQVYRTYEGSGSSNDHISEDMLPG